MSTFTNGIETTTMNKIQNWEELTAFVANRYELGTSMEEILFLIGVQEYEQGFKPYSKDEKLALIKIALLRLFSEYGYFVYKGRDSKNWPLWELAEGKTLPDAEEQAELLKKAIINYFNQISTE